MLIKYYKHVNDDLFNYYRQDTNVKRVRKEEYINTEKMHDKIYMDQIKRSNLEEKMRQESERQKRINDNMNDFSKFWGKKDEERRNNFAKKSDVHYENYNKGNSLSLGNMEMFNSNINPNSPQSINPDMTLINMNKVKKDNLNHILYPEYMGVRKLDEIEKKNKNEYQKFYRNVLDSQMNYRTKSPDMMQTNNYKNVVNMVSNPCKKLFFF